GPWEMEQENIWFTDEDGYTKHLAYVEQGDDVDDKQDHYNTAYIAAANPATMLALLDENIQLQREKDAIEAVALALRDDMRQARERLAAAEQERENWRISFDNERYRADKLAAALNAEREKLVMANRSLITQHTRANSAESRIAELEARTVCLPKLPVLGSTAERYEGFADGASSMRNECANAIHAAGIKVEGE
ncbi:ead/Ea22-like family protein, partial [Salmonella enterica subsp. enterica serovar Lubbock]|nr:ead/Ea22-like family protein [Salmonella enterica subsp. enterica serovar Lubbock]MEA7465377.1 ead/Ea22-like family protein [Salmonella enterica subsp. enterica serovar Lubbock]MEA8326318.1 ead/Ea22-like family protein [Salmonella enterica subsp. enterica serovar Lubbock]